MKAIFLTSSLGCSIKANGKKIVTNCDNSNGFVDELKRHICKIDNLVYVASDPFAFDISDEKCKFIAKGLTLDGFDVNKAVVIDDRFKGNIKKQLLSADVIFLAGGHVPTQNNYFKQIGLKEILQNYDGIVIGQSAGSMNSASIVYCQPEYEEELLNKNFQKRLTGLGLTDIMLMPHMNRAKIDTLLGKTTYQLCLEDSFDFPHYGIEDGGFIEIVNGVATAYGKTVFIKNGFETVLCENGQKIVIEDKQLKLEK